MKSVELGQSHEKRKLIAHEFKPSGISNPEWILFLGAHHGNEIEGVWLLDEIVKSWNANFKYGYGAIVWPQINPDGVAAGNRLNAKGVDLNRNLPSKDWTAEILNPKYPPGPSPASEPETKALVKLIADKKPRAILTVHSFSNYQININGPEPVTAWADRLKVLCNYEVTKDIGYPTPGSLGNYAGGDLQIPEITLEIERGMEREKVVRVFVPVIEASMKFWCEVLEREDL